MMSLTTAQRDLLRRLLLADAPLSAAALGQQLSLTPRQIQYGLREIKGWLERRHVTLRHTPGVGAQVLCPPAQRQRLLDELAAHARFQLVLTAEQRQQLLALLLLADSAPRTLSQFQDAFAVARATVLKDLDTIAPWLGRFQVTVGRRQHRGFWAEGRELAIRQALAALLWGDLPVERPISHVEVGQRISFALGADARLLPAVAQAATIIAGCGPAGAQPWVALAEAELGGRFADGAAARLALALAIQIQRVGAGRLIDWEAEAAAWLVAQPTWPASERLAAQIWPGLPALGRRGEAAALALLLLAHERDEPWHPALNAQPLTDELVEALMAQIAEACGLPELAHDPLLRDGMESHILPACVRGRFGLWAPARAIVDTQGERYRLEREIALQLSGAIRAALGVALPPDAFDNLVLLLHAALVRARPERARRVLVICPSGMATTQLLVARLKARMPRLGHFEVLPMRALSAERVADADLIITTVPLSLPAEYPITVIQVHPMLKPEDIATLSQYM